MSEENKEQQTTETTQTGADLSNADSQAAEIPTSDDIQTGPAANTDELYDFDEPGDVIPSGQADTKDGEDTPVKGAEDDARTTGKEKTADTPTFSDELLARAEKAGLTKDELADFGTPDAAQKALSLFEKKSTATGTQTTETGKEAQTGTQTDKSGFEKFKVELDPDVYDPEIITTINGINEHYSKQFEAMQGQLVQAQGALNRQQALQFEQQFDGYIDGLGDGYKDVLGEGRGAEMDKTSETFKNRVKLLDEMETIAAGCSRTGKQVPPYNELFDKALASVFKDKQKEIVRKEISSKLGKRQIIARPSQRRGGNVDPESAARSYVKQFLEERDTSEPSNAMDF